MQRQTQRIEHLDFLRGFAVIAMIMGHSVDSVLSVEARTTEVFRMYDAIRGFTAPLFLFIAGYAFAVVTSRRWEEYVVFGPAARTRMTRMGLLLALGYALHFPFFSLAKLLQHTTPEEFSRLFQVDVLHCLSVTTIALLVLILIARTVRRFVVVSASLGAGILLASPLVWNLDIGRVLPPMMAPYFTQQVPSLFPLFPFSVYLIVGAVGGHLHIQARSEGRERDFLRFSLLVGILAGCVGYLSDLFPLGVYPAHDFWKVNPGFLLIRLGIIVLLASAFFQIRRLPETLIRHLAILGRASLMVYVVHLLLVYGSAANPGLHQIIGPQLWYPGAFALALCVVALMVTLVHAWNTMQEHHYYPLRLFQAGVTSTLLYFFLTKPY